MTNKTNMNNNKIVISKTYHSLFSMTDDSFLMTFLEKLLIEIHQI